MSLGSKSQGAVRSSCINPSTPGSGGGVATAPAHKRSLARIPADTRAPSIPEAHGVPVRQYLAPSPKGPRTINFRHGRLMRELLIEAAVGLGVLFILAFGNGANDVGKSVVSLMTDPETAGFRPSYRPLLWGGFFSGLGSVSAIIISGRLFDVFDPERLLTTTPSSTFILAALAGAAGWVLLGTVLRIPVSTTHAIVGAIVLQAAFLFGASKLAWDFLVSRILLPLAAGPFAALIGAYLLSRLARRGTPGEDSSKRFGVADWGSAAAIAYGRGVNDAPKMAALGVFFIFGTTEESTLISYLIVGMAVVAGSLVWGDRVAKTLVGRAAPLDHGQRVKAGAATAALLSAGAFFGDPFSATQISQGATAGAGKRKWGILRSSLRSMALAWLVTLPAAGCLAIAASYFGARFWG